MKGVEGLGSDVEQRSEVIGREEEMDGCVLVFEMVSRRRYIYVPLIFDSFDSRRNGAGTDKADSKFQTQLSQP